MDLETMKNRASTDVNGIASFETGSELIRCKATGEGYEWRIQTAAHDGRGGRKVNEATVASILARGESND